MEKLASTGHLHHTDSPTAAHPPTRAGKHTDSAVYDLVGVVDHAGSINSGHYTAYNFNSFTRRWYRYNDSTVTMLEPQQPVKDTLAAQVAAEKKKAADKQDKAAGAGGNDDPPSSSKPAATGDENTLSDDEGAPPDAAAVRSETEARRSDTADNEAPQSDTETQQSDNETQQSDTEAPQSDKGEMDVEDVPDDPPAPTGEKTYKGKALSSYLPEELREALRKQIVTPNAYILFYARRENDSPYDGEPFEIPDAVRKEYQEVKKDDKAPAESNGNVALVDSKTAEAATDAGAAAASSPMDISPARPPRLRVSPTVMAMTARAVQNDPAAGRHTRSKSDPIDHAARIHPASMVPMAPPPDEAIAQFIGITTCSRDEAVSFLNRSGNNLERAIGLFYS